MMTVETSPQFKVNAGEPSSPFGRKVAGPDILKLYILNALESKRKGDSRLYNHLVSELDANKGNSVVLQRWLSALSLCAASISVQPFKELVQRLFVFDWATSSDAVADAFASCLENLVASNLAFLEPCFHMLVRSLLPPGDATEDLPKAQVGYDRAHRVLERILFIFPTASNCLFGVIAEHFPHKRQDVLTHTVFLRNLLRMITYADILRDRLLALITDHLIQIDVDIRLEDAPDPDDEQGVFRLDPCDVPSAADPASADVGQSTAAAAAGTGTEQAAPETTDVMATKLDFCMDLMFRYLASILAPAADVPGASGPGRPVVVGARASAVELFTTLLRIFEASVLNTYKCKYTQFLLFYSCSFRPAEFPARFLERCFYSRLFRAEFTASDVGVDHDVTRIACAAYVGSFIGRSTYVPMDTVKDALSRMADWAQSYVTQHDLLVAYPDAEVHAVFYAVCQSILYIICYKSDALLDALLHDDDDTLPPSDGTDDDPQQPGLVFLRSLGLQRLVDSRLNPLKMCLPSVVKEFARKMRHVGAAQCGHVLARNKQLVLPTKSARGGLNQLDNFFPFDPYLLKHSYPYIKDLYQVWRGSTSDKVSDTGDENDDDSLASTGSLTDSSESAGSGSFLEDLNFGRSLTLDGQWEREDDDEDGEEDDEEDEEEDESMMFSPPNALTASATASSAPRAVAAGGPRGRGRPRRLTDMSL